jgi:hypothetical protein
MASAEAILRTDEVFGVARDVPPNYVVRDAVDGQLVSDLARDKHIVIHGGSKQGKTCVRKHCLHDSDYILVQCSNRWSLADLHSNILKRAGFEVALSNSKSHSGKARVKVEYKGFAVQGEGGTEVMQETAPLELDVDDVNDVIEALESIGFAKFIVLEDFHYLQPETQADFSVALKAFHESSKFCFIIVGVWLEQNRLVVYNGDLTGRVVSVNADRWSSDQLREVISDGAALLNVEFDDAFIDSLLDNCFESVAIVQEVCWEACTREGVTSTAPATVPIGAGVDAQNLVGEVIAKQDPRYRSFLRSVADGFQASALEMYKWLVYCLVDAAMDELEAGLPYREILKRIRAKHPQKTSLNPGNVTQALQFVASLQIKKEIKPLIVDYDQTNRRLNVVDRGFLIWLASQEKAELLDEIGL